MNDSSPTFQMHTPEVPDDSRESTGLDLGVGLCEYGNMTMSENIKLKYEARARIAKAMSHPSRLLMLDLLQKKEMCVGELTEEVGADQSTVSKHLAILKNVGLVSVRREGSLSYYQLKCGCLDGFFSCMEAVLVSELSCHQEALR